MALQAPTSAPYVGYRADLCSLVANLAFRDGAAADAIASAGGAELLLAQARVDEEAPMAREWALWGVRNLTESSEVAHERLRGLDAIQPQSDPELSKRGISVELRPDGKPALRHTDQG